MPLSSGAIVIVLTSAISNISSRNSIDGSIDKAGWAPIFFGFMNGPSKCIPNIFPALLLFLIFLSAFFVCLLYSSM